MAQDGFGGQDGFKGGGGGGSSSSGTVKITGADTTADVLDTKLLVTAGHLTKAVGSPGGNETLTLGLASVGPGAGAIGGAAQLIRSLTLDAQGRVTAATATDLSAVSGLLKSAAGVLSAAVAGTDFCSFASGGASRIPFGSGTANGLTDAADLTYNSTTHDLALSVAESGGTVGFLVANTSNTASSLAAIVAQVAGATANNPVYQAIVSGVTTWTWGIDNASSDRWALNPSASLGTNDVITILTTGQIGLRSAPNASFTLASSISGLNLFGVGTTGTTVRGGVVVTAGGGGEIDIHQYGSATAGTVMGETVAGLSSIESFPSASNGLHIGVNGDTFIGFTTNSVRRFTLNSTRALFAQRINANKGADVASAGTITLGAGGNAFDITGTTTIDYLTTTNWQNGSMVVLQFDASVTVNHNTGSVPANTKPFLLAGAANFAATAGDTLTLFLHEDGWREMARAVI